MVGELERIEEEYPYLQRELDRMARRRWIFRFVKRHGVGAEVGVFRGRFSELLVKRLKPRKIYLIDPWTQLGEFFNLVPAYTNDGKLPTKVAKRETELRMSRYPGVEVRIEEGYFLDAVGKIEERLDWIYIDGSHLYQDVLNDLHAASGILKDDGKIMGDDWQPNPAKRTYDVFRAVQAFTRATDYQIIGAGDGQYCLRRELPYSAAEDS